MSMLQYIKNSFEFSATGASSHLLQCNMWYWVGLFIRTLEVSHGIKYRYMISAVTTYLPMYTSDSVGGPQSTLF